MLSLSWIFLWLVVGERMEGFNISDCPTKRLVRTYSSGSEEKLVLFCDLKNCNDNKSLSDVHWYLQYPNGTLLGEITKNYSHILPNKSLYFSTIGLNDSGSYICRPRMRSPQDENCCVKIVLEVKPKTKESCASPVPHKQALLLGATDLIFCPCLSNQSGAPELTWYQNGKLMPEIKSNPLPVNEVFVQNQGTYVCDYTQSDQAGWWTVRAVIRVITIVKDTKHKPEILDPINDTLEVELGKSLTLNCTAQFGFEKDFKPVIRWYIKDSDQEWEFPASEEERIESLTDDKIKRAIFLKEVTLSDLRKKFICFAQNSIGNTTQSIQLKAKRGVVFIYILLGTTMTLAGVLMGCVLLYKYWIEIVLLYRTYQSKDEMFRDKKEFDAFISYAKCSSFENESAVSLSEENLALNLFPEVLENKYGYALCLLERDVVPGGVYTEDIVDIIKKSRRGIFILSPDYFSGPGVFELQAAVNLALDDQTLKLVLIKFCSFQEPDTLPHLVKKALRVLPMVTWKGLKSIPSNSRFWTQIRYHMPVKKSKGFM
ncbi:PREDICTED: interleukin-18 receptor accessory protein [Condylura cristata]|uniref:interleukin-18 receptor accessory protein n=1 Tax=Condylura cristata TaxID=143302 RepID=UPI0006439136|nr:PREDICTED: interleukin-18 receptor accessory protein [Condylura cristata]